MRTATTTDTGLCALFDCLEPGEATPSDSALWLENMPGAQRELYWGSTYNEISFEVAQKNPLCERLVAACVDHSPVLYNGVRFYVDSWTIEGHSPYVKFKLVSAPQ